MITVITTINPPTKAVNTLADKSWLFVVGDKKTPKNFNVDNTNVIYFNHSHQQNLKFSLKHYLSDNHYSRKNLGYLCAIKAGAAVIYDTDDDNIPNDNWSVRTASCEAYKVESPGWCNVYKYFHDNIWPRGFSLKKINNPIPDTKAVIVNSPIQQGFADGSPDVDAIWRLIFNKEIGFRERKSIHLSDGAWCPFNSQSTWFFPEAFPLLYLPVHASFRMTDIWRSFVAQRCLWEMGKGVVFHSPSEVYQERNPHDLLKDFEDEVSGYLNNDNIVETLSTLKLTGDIFENLTACYQAIVNIGVLPEMEMRAVNAWVKDVKEIWK